jgi:hypothetical protein
MANSVCRGEYVSGALAKFGLEFLPRGGALGAPAPMFDSLSEATAIVQVSLNDGRGSGKVRARRGAEGSVRVQFDALHQDLHVFGLHARRIELRQPHLAITEGNSQSPMRRTCGAECISTMS